MPGAGTNAPVLLTGATGYVGGRLLRLLEARGLRVRCLARRPEALAGLGPKTEVLAGDVLDERSLRRALGGVGVAYYLVHSMGSAGSFEQEDRIGAATFARAAREAGVRRIVYLGGLGAGAELSSHLASRQEVGRILAGSGVQTLEFRASIVIGSGSLSFEMIRALVDRLPIMVTPRWVRTLAQPIAIDDLLSYLLAALDVEVDGSRLLEIGGADRVSYDGLMREYARQAGRRVVAVPVPLLTPRLSSLWLGLVTPIYARVGRKLIDSLPHETVVRDDSALELFAISPVGHREAIGRALEEERALAETPSSGAVPSAGRAGQAERAEQPHTHVIERKQLVRRPLDEVFAFFADASNLGAITPPELRFRILTPLPVEMGPGTVIDYELALHRVPFRWRTEIVDWEENRGFVDVQRRGPYALWEHTHTFEAVDGGTLIRDRVRYRLPFGSLGELAHRVRVRRDVERIFDFRRAAIERLL